MLAVLMLQGLTIDYEPLRIAIENSKVTLTRLCQDLDTLDYVKTKLVTLEDLQEETESDVALITRRKDSYNRKKGTLS